MLFIHMLLWLPSSLLRVENSTYKKNTIQIPFNGTRIHTIENTTKDCFIIEQYVYILLIESLKQDFIIE